VLGAVGFCVFALRTLRRSSKQPVTANLCNPATYWVDYRAYQGGNWPFVPVLLHKVSPPRIPVSENTLLLGDSVNRGRSPLRSACEGRRWQYLGDGRWTSSHGWRLTAGGSRCCWCVSRRDPADGAQGHPVSKTSHWGDPFEAASF
jgi:hypothetical protein